jgi:hypothetical protein
MVTASSAARVGAVNTHDRAIALIVAAIALRLNESRIDDVLCTGYLEEAVRKVMAPL